MFVITKSGSEQPSVFIFRFYIEIKLTTFPGSPLLPFLPDWALVPFKKTERDNIISALCVSQIQQPAVNGAASEYALTSQGEI